MSYGRSISGRVRALERQAHERGTCRVCGGEGAAGLVFEIEGSEPATEPEACPGCGKADLMRFRLVEAAGSPAS